MKRKDMTVSVLLERAQALFLQGADKREACRFLYTAILKAGAEVPADAFRALIGAFNGPETVIFSAAVLEFAVSEDSPLTLEEKQLFRDFRLRLLWSWGVAKHKTEEKDLPDEAFAVADDFMIDVGAYQGVLKTILDKAGDLAGAYAAAVRLCGVFAGALEHKTKGSQVSLGDLFVADDFVPGESYLAWLEQE